MAEFLSDLVFIFELFAIAAGLVLLDRARTGNSGYLKTAGWLLVVGGIGAAMCTGYYWFKYHGQGDFDRAYPPVMMQDMQGMGMMKMMQGNRQSMGMGMQGGQQGMGMKGGGMMGQQNCPQGTRPEDCPGAGMMMQDGQMPKGRMNPEGRMENTPEPDHDHAESTE